ncbi:hypothetical protein KAR91_39555 [Candidatus Pacearchaeota archaeon]|nr:hypothetical protein [Candidatus Pacearchaeota archaeon]
MKKIFYDGSEVAVPETINGINMRKKLGIPKDRAMYTELDGKNKLVSDGDTLYVRDGMQVGDLPHTEKG